MKMRQRKQHRIWEMIIFVILSFSLSMGLFWLLKEPLTSVLEWAAVRMGSSFSGRSAAVQQFIYIVIVAASGCVLYFLLKKLSRADRKISETIVIVFLAAVLAMLFVLCFEQTLRRDDYWETHDAQKYGFPGFLLLEFKSVNGRYFSLLLRSMYAFFDPEQYIHAALAVNIGCLFAACIYLCRTLLFLSGHKVTMSRSLTGGAILALSALFMSPKIWEVWFWGSGTFVYGVGITLAIAILALYLDTCRGNTHIPLTILCITCACGASELITASVCSFGVGLLLINWITGNKKRNKPLLFFTLWSFLCTGFVLVFSASAGYAGELSGGDAAGPGGFFGSLLLKLPGLLYESAGMLADYFYSRLEYAVYLMIAAFLFGIAFPKKKLNAVPILLGIVWMILTSVGALTMNIMMHYVPGRVITIPLLWLFIPMAVCVFLLGTAVDPGAVSPAAKVVPAACSAFLFIPVCVLYKDSAPLLRDIHEGWRYRDAMIRSVEDKSQPLEVCTIPVIGSTDRDLSVDPDFEINLVTAVYYEFPQIIGGEPCPPFNQ